MTVGDEFNPYHAPETPAEPDLAPPAHRRPSGLHGFGSARVRALVTVGLLVAGTLLGLVAIGCYGAQIAMLDGSKNGREFTPEEDEANDARIVAVSSAQIAISLATGIAFFAWVHRVYANLPVLGARGLQYSPGWAIGGFFVPFVNFVIPYLVLAETWKASKPDVGISTQASRSWVSAPAVLWFWWGLLLIQPLGETVSNAAASGARSVDDDLRLSGLLIVLNVLGCLLCLLAISVVRGITGCQERKRARIEAGAYPELSDEPSENPVRALGLSYDWGKAVEPEDELL